MFTTYTPYLSSEIDYRREELRRSWGRSKRSSGRVVRPGTRGSQRVALAH